MIEWLDISPDVNVQEAEFQRLLGYPPQHVLDGPARELANQTREWFAANGKPWIYARQVDALHLSDTGEIKIAASQFSSKRFHDQLATAEAHAVTLVAVSAGRQCEEKARELWREGKPDEYFFLEVFGSAVVEHLVAQASGRLCAWADQNNLGVLPHYSPGYSGWDISDQRALKNLIVLSAGKPLPDELHVFDSGMLQPKKSLLAVFGLTPRVEKVRELRGMVPCESCSLPRCQYRRKPYRNVLPQIEDVRRLNQNRSILETDSKVSALTRGAKYTVNLRALRKWAAERLQLTTLPDNSIEARFRYEGTTCVNLGHSLEFDYRIKLASPQESYRILEMSCSPTQSDVGHKSQCEYLKDADALMRAIATEKPLLGQPLDAVLTWQRAYAPSGCFCDADRRAHKWGLVFEVLHYALVQREAEQHNGHSQRISTTFQSA